MIIDQCPYTNEQTAKEECVEKEFHQCKDKAHSFGLSIFFEQVVFRPFLTN